MPLPIRTPPATCSGVISSDSRTSAKSAADERLRVREERRARGADLAATRNQSTFVSTSGPSVAKTSSAQTVQPQRVVLLGRLREADEGEQHPARATSTSALMREGE